MRIPKRAAILFIVTILSFLIGGGVTSANADNNIHVPASAPLNTDSAGRGGVEALQSVVRILCLNQGTSGTGFLHKSGKIITAAHVVKGCTMPLIALSNGQQIIGTQEAIDEDVDLAIINPSTPINATPLEISTIDNLSIGTQVSTWGYPGGYSGRAPMLSVGYLAGVDARQLPNQRTVTRWVVNAAFNSGNSGGPVLQIETGRVVGVVLSKLAPLSPTAMSILQALEKQQSGFVYTATLPDGSKKNFSEGQIVGEVLNELRGQIQLVIGYAVLTSDLRSFLSSHSIEP